MQSKVIEIARDTYRISTFHPDYGIQFNQFLIKDDEPFLMHTGFKGMFQTTLEGVTSIIDPVNLGWIGFSHFESDECGALNEWLGVAPHAQARRYRRIVQPQRAGRQERLPAARSSPPLRPGTESPAGRRRPGWQTPMRASRSAQ